MILDYKFVDSIRDLVNSILEFYSKPELWKPVLASAPKYFIHLKNNGKHIFGLSKFCAFKNITVEEYISTYRHKTDGGTTQKHIAWLTEKNWILRSQIDNEVRNAFDNWISNFFPNYNLNNASLISIKNDKEIQIPKNFRMSIAELKRTLNQREEIGEIGENIAIKYEKSRLENLGVKEASKYISHVSKINVSAGYDIYTEYKKERRFIEVKSSTKNALDFFISENEMYTLKTLEDEAYLYFVQINNLKEQSGDVVRIIKNPIPKLQEFGGLKPVIYKGSVKNI